MSPTLPPSTTDRAVVPTMGDIVSRIAAEVAMPLTTALDRVLALASSGRIDRPGLQALCAEIDGARRVGMRGQQIVRFANGLVQQQLERLDLTGLLRGVLAEQTAARTLASRQTLAAVEVMGDTSLVHAVLQAAADWSVALARAGVEWRLEVQPWPVQARVSCRFAHRPADLDGSIDEAADARCAGEHPACLDSLDWLLLQYSAHIAGVVVRREDSASHTQLTLAFPNTVNHTLEGASAVELGARDGGTALLSGSQVLVLAARRDARQQVRAAMHGHDLFVDYVPSVADAARYCADGAPQVLIFESSFDGDALRALCAQLASVSPGVALVEILPSGHGCEMGGPAGPAELSAARVGAEGLRQTLASVMVLELARRR